jgi:DNA replication protein DnaC
MDASWTGLGRNPLPAVLDTSFVRTRLHYQQPPSPPPRTTRAQRPAGGTPSPARNRAARRVREAGFPRPKRLEEFSFDANPAVSPAVIGQLATCGWVKAGHPLCLIGGSGTGKTHLLIALGTLAAEAGHPVRYTLASKLVNELAEAADERQLSKLIARYGRVDLICLTSWAIWNWTGAAPNCCPRFSLSGRNARRSPSLPTSHSPDEWTKTFTDPRLCAAIVDRLTFAGQIIETGTVSYRLAHARQQQNAKKAASTPAR